MGNDICYLDHYDESKIEIKNKSELNDTFVSFSKRIEIKTWLTQQSTNNEEEYILEKSLLKKQIEKTIK